MMGLYFLSGFNNEDYLYSLRLRNYILNIDEHS
jgi:hypothetical protein